MARKKECRAHNEMKKVDHLNNSRKFLHNPIKKFSYCELNVASSERLARDGLMGLHDGLGDL